MEDGVKFPPTKLKTGKLKVVSEAIAEAVKLAPKILSEGKDIVVSESIVLG
jgi:hypothetical protein